MVVESEAQMIGSKNVKTLYTSDILEQQIFRTNKSLLYNSNFYKRKFASMQQKNCSTELYFQALYNTLQTPMGSLKQNKIMQSIYVIILQQYKVKKLSYMSYYDRLLL